MNYFKSVLTPIRIFTGRKQLNWFQIIIVLLFINGLMMIPLSLNIAKMESYPVEETYPNAFALLEESVVDALDDAEYSEGKLTLPDSFYFEIENGIVGGNVSASEEENAITAESALLFQERELIIKDKENPVATVPYTIDFAIEKVTSVEELKTELSRQWFIQNKGFIVGSLLASLFILLLVSVVAISLGSSLFVLLTKKGQLSTIETYKESVNLVVNSLGLPTLLAMLVGLIQFNIITMIMVQTFGFIMMLLFVFMKTRFSDDYMEQLEVVKKED
jgi:maltodextrin utilization protein YvdJ